MEEKTRKTVNDFTVGPMWKVILRMSIPMILAQLVCTLYSLVDRMYIGHMEGVGSLALTGLGLTMPIVSLLNALAALCGAGGAPLCSIARGRGDLKDAERIMGNALTMLLIIAAAATVLIDIYMKPILYLLGASDATYPFAAEYARIYILGTVFVMLSLGMNYFINSQGFSKIGMMTVSIGAVLNIVLDPIMIFALHLGIRGAAIATVISQAVSAAWAMGFLCSKKTILDLTLANMRLRWSVVRRILALGFTGFVMQATNSVVIMVANTQLRAFGGDLYVGTMTVVNSVREVIILISHGLTQASMPVLGYNFGAQAFGRVKQGIRFIVAASSGYAILCWVVVMLFTRQIVCVFNSEPELLAIALPSMRVFFCGFVLMSLQMAGQCVFVGLGKSRQATFFSLLRKVIIIVPAMLLLPRIPMFGVMGVFWSEPISDVLGGFFCFFTMYFTIYRKLEDVDMPRPNGGN